MIVGVPVTCVQGRSRASHENRIGNHLLQARRGLQDCQQLGAGIGKGAPRWQALVRKLSFHRSMISDVIIDYGSEEVTPPPSEPGSQCLALKQVPRVWAVDRSRAVCAIGEMGAAVRGWHAGDGFAV